jgi:DNA-binding transcriptional regulator GbsR (MarR family)
MEGGSMHEIEFARFTGELAESLSFNKSIGQIFGLLYLSNTPLSLDEISSRLAMSKGNASINLRYLESWGAVRPAAVSGTRRDHYQANTNLKEIILRRVEEGISRRLDLADERLGQIGLPSDPQSKKKIQSLRNIVNGSRKALKILPSVLKFLPK